MKQFTFAVAVIVFVTAGVGCRSTNRLADYEFSGQRLALNTTLRARPHIDTDDFYFVNAERPLKTLLRFGSSIVKNAEAEKAQARMDSAAQMVDVSAILYDRILSQSALYLDANPVAAAGEADFLLDVHIREYGIEAHGWDAAAHFRINVRAQLVDQRAGRLIWETRLEEREAIAPHIFGPHPGIRNVITAGALAGLSVEELADGLEELADYAADRVTRRLQRDLYRSRE